MNWYFSGLRTINAIPFWIVPYILSGTFYLFLCRLHGIDIEIKCIGKCFSKSYYVTAIDYVLDLAQVKFASNTMDIQKKSTEIAFEVQPKIGGL